jgi:hypothetical protein
MKQRIITAFCEFKQNGTVNLDSITQQIGSQNYVIKQVVSTSLELHSQYPRLAVTLLLEKID